MNLAYNTISKSLSVLFLLCIIPSIYSRPFLDDVWGAVQYVLNGGSLTSIEKIPMNEELKQTGLNFIENKTVFYTKQRQKRAYKNQKSAKNTKKKQFCKNN